MNSISKYYHQSVNDFIKWLSAIKANNDEETVHELRLEFNRIRALNKFILRDIISPEDLKDYSNKLDIIYKQAGMSRVIHVNQKLLKKYSKLVDKPFDEFGEYLNDKVTEINSMLEDQIRHIDIPGTIKAELDINKHLSEFDERDVVIKGIRFIKRKIRKIDTLIFYSAEKERYHEIRKNIKEVLFLAGLLFTRQYLSKSGSYFSRMKKIGIHIGQWHDNDVLLNNLYNYFKIKHITNYDTSRSKYKALIDQIRHKQNMLLKGIDNRIIRANLELDYLIGKKELKYYLQS